MVVISWMLYHAAPQLSRVGSTMQEENWGTNATLCEVDVDPLNHERHMLLLMSLVGENASVNDQ